jgi:hypothetical protein
LLAYAYEFMTALHTAPNDTETDKLQEYVLQKIDGLRQVPEWKSRREITDFLKRHVEKAGDGEKLTLQVRFYGLGQGKAKTWDVEWRIGRLGIVDGEMGYFDTEMTESFIRVCSKWIRYRNELAESSNEGYMLGDRSF